MKVLLTQDVYKLGRAGDVKKVADGYGRNYLIPQGMAVLATPGALKQAEYIRKNADVKRAVLNEEMSGISELITDLTLKFAAKAGETDKLYGSITSQMIVDAIHQKLGIELNRRHIDHEPIRTLGVHKVSVRLTMDLIPEVTVIVHREGEAVHLEEPEEVEEAPISELEDVELQAELEEVSSVEDIAESDAEDIIEDTEVIVEAVDLEEETETDTAD